MSPTNTLYESARRAALALVHSPDLSLEVFPIPHLTSATTQLVRDAGLLSSIAADSNLACQEFSRLSCRAAESARLVAEIENRTTHLEKARRAFQAESERRLPNQSPLQSDPVSEILNSEWLHWAQSQADELNALELEPGEADGYELIAGAGLALKRLRDLSRRDFSSLAAEREEVLDHARQLIEGLIFLGHVKRREAQTLHELDRKAVYDIVAALTALANSATAALRVSEKPVDF